MHASTINGTAICKAFFVVLRPAREFFTITMNSFKFWPSVFFSDSNLLWHGSSVNKSPGTREHTSTAVNSRFNVCSDWGSNPNLPHARRTLYHWATAGGRVILTSGCIIITENGSEYNYCYQIKLSKISVIYHLNHIVC